MIARSYFSISAEESGGGKGAEGEAGGSKHQRITLTRRRRHGADKPTAGAKTNLLNFVRDRDAPHEPGSNFARAGDSKETQGPGEKVALSLRLSFPRAHRPS